MGLFTLEISYLGKKKAKDYIYLIQMISILEIGKETVWMDMEHISLLQEKFIKVNLKKGLKRATGSAFIPMGNLMKAFGVKIVKLGLERLNFLMK